MITEDLIAYIQKKRREKLPDTEITARLSKAGWHMDDILEGFLKITPPIPIHQSVKPPLATVPPVAPHEKIEPHPIVPEITPSHESSLQLEQLEIEEPKAAIPPITPPIPNPPLVVPKPPARPLLPDIKDRAEAPTTPKPAEAFVQPTPFSPQSPTEVKPIFKDEEFIPKLIPKQEPTQQINMDSLAKKLPEAAIITTFSRDMQAAQGATPVLPPKQKKNTKKFLKILLIVIVLSAIIGAVVAYYVGPVSLPSFSFIKKDPKMLLLNTSSALGAFQSYTSETEATVSFPSFANIANGLISGDRVTSINRDSVSIDIENTLGQNTRALLSPARDYAIHIRSSVLKNDIYSHLKYDGTTSYLTIPDLGPIIGEDAPTPGIVALKNDQFDKVLPTLVPDSIASTLGELNINAILTNAISLHNSSAVTSLLKTFIESATVTEKPTETIDGALMYHYEMIVNRQEVKNLLHTLFDPTLMTLSIDQKKNIDELFGATTLNTFEVWVGKRDSLVHRYTFQATVPLSKVINFEDKGIAGSGVILDWQTTYHDFNIPKVVSIPDNAIPVAEFLTSVTDLKIKNALSRFAPAALTLRHALGSYGKRANPTGTCINPNSSSLFSPVGHTKGAANAVGTIASTMNSLLNITNGAGSCFSTPTAWAVSFPRASDPLSSYCVDSIGTSITRTAPLKGTVCK